LFEVGNPVNLTSKRNRMSFTEQRLKELSSLPDSLGLIRLNGKRPADKWTETRFQITKEKAIGELSKGKHFNYGVPLGQTAGFNLVVIDVDVSNGKTGLQSLVSYLRAGHARQDQVDIIFTSIYLRILISGIL
jgi:hypothetical protein